MSIPEPLAPAALYSRCDPEEFNFDTTAELQGSTEIIGQARAQKAVHFGVGMGREGYNLYVMGPPGMGKHAMVRSFLQEKADQREIPGDICYVNNFALPHKPRALRLPAGWGNRLRKDMEQLVEELSTTIPAVFESDEYRNRIQALSDEYNEKQEHAFGDLSADAGKEHIRLFRTPSGFAFAPLDGDDEVIGPEDFEKLPKDEQKRIEAVVAKLQEKLQAVIQQIPQWRKESRERIKSLNRELSLSAVEHGMADLKHTYAELESVMEYLEAVEKDIIDHVEVFRHGDEQGDEKEREETSPKDLHRYKVNVLVDNGECKGAPVVYLDHPTFADLVGRAEHLAQMGTLITDFTLLKPGALHRACGGYLILDAHKLLSYPFAWEGLKRSLYANEVRIESLDRMFSMVSTVSLEPEPLPLDIKVVLLGDRMLYYLLYEYDPDFAELFKVAADFEDEIDRTPDNNQLYARLIATLASKEELRPFDRGAVARVIEFGAREVEDARKLSTHMRSLGDLLREADYYAGEQGREVVLAEDIQTAIDEQQHRAGRVRERIQEEIQRGVIYIDTTGAKVGQINGLSVLHLGTTAFGQPSRITATVHIGEGHVVDIEREVELGGALHSKGVLILSAFIAARYAKDHPLSLSASLVFEQSYGGVDGDSASLAELCALLSAIAEVSIKQFMAVTGSVNQHGQVQPIGGVNQKIEGFFDICKARGLSGNEAVLIPASNVQHLMLRQEVVDAAAAGQFKVYPVATVDEALELLTGLETGQADPQGEYPQHSLNARVLERLTDMARIRQSFGDHGKDDGKEDEGQQQETGTEQPTGPDDHATRN